MKSENQIIVRRCKQPVKIDKPFQSLLTFAYIAGEKKIFFRPFYCHFFSVYSFNAVQSDNNSNRIYVLGHKYILGSSQSSF